MVRVTNVKNVLVVVMIVPKIPSNLRDGVAEMPQVFVSTVLTVQDALLHALPPHLNQKGQYAVLLKVHVTLMKLVMAKMIIALQI
jgi:hypothetical protein